MLNIRTVLVSTVAGVAIAASGSAAAQSAPDTAPTVDHTAAGGAPDQLKSPPGQDGLADVVVTARRREESLQKTPIAVTALDAAALTQRNITNISQIGALTPSLQLSASAPQSGSSAALTAYIRGIGQLDFTIFTDPGVGVYVDGVYVARSVGSAFDLIDPERVEVLRGPQGTLFGRNTIAGAINLVSKSPADHLAATGSLALGTYSQIVANGSVDAPISDTLRSKFSLLVDHEGGYVHNRQLEERLGKANVVAGRAQLQWSPSSTFTANLVGDYTRRRDSSAPIVLIASSGTGFADLNGTPRPAGAGNPTLIYAANVSLGGVCATNPDSSRSCLGAAWIGAPYDTYDGTHFDSNVDARGVALTLENRSTVSIKSITAYRWLDANYGRDSDHTPYTAFASALDDRQRQFSQELQVYGKAFRDRLDYLVGAYYFDETGSESFLNLAGNFSSNAEIRIRTDSLAFFGESTAHLTDWLKLTGGLRWSRDNKRFQTDQFFISGALSGTRIVTDNSWQRRQFSNVTPRVTLSADATSNLLLYLTYSTGFKSGGFNARYSGAIVPAPISFAPETSKNYEAGFKLTTVDRRLRLNADVFQIDYSDIQVNFRPNLTSQLQVIGNAAAARIRGVEAELSLRPVAALRANISGSYLDPKYTGIGSAVGNITLGSKFPYAPKWKVNADTSYDFAVGHGAVVSPAVSISYQSKVFNDAINSTPIVQKGYSVIGASLTYDSRHSWQFTAGVDNLNDAHYLTSAAYSPTLGVAEGAYARPRQWYVRAKAKF